MSSRVTTTDNRFRSSLFSDDNQPPPGQLGYQPPNYALANAMYFSDLLDLHGIAEGNPSQTQKAGTTAALVLT